MSADVRAAVPADAGQVAAIFAQAGRLCGVGRKHGRWIDTVLMQKDLRPGR
jgi:L-amino acid N-acyltransferase YncA